MLLLMGIRLHPDASPLLGVTVQIATGGIDESPAIGISIAENETACVAITMDLIINGKLFFTNGTNNPKTHTFHQRVELKDDCPLQIQKHGSPFVTTEEALGAAHLLYH